MKKSPKLVTIATLALLSIIALLPPVHADSPAPAPTTQSSATDDRLAFLMVQLSSVEASINAANSALRSAGYRAAVVSDKANTYAKGNELMDRNGGGPVAWRDFYGSTAHRFAPRDIDGIAHNYQRPDQFNYVYRANNEQIIKANQEIAALGQRVDALLARRKQLESQQSALWATITFESIANQEYALQPLYRLQLQVKPSSNSDKSTATARLEVLHAAVLVLRTADHTVAATMDSLNARQEDAYITLRETMQNSHNKFQDTALSFTDTAAPADSQAIKDLLALSKKMTAQSKNMCDAYKLALDSDASGDEASKQTLRGQLQRSLMGFAETTGQMDQALTKLAKTWDIQSQPGMKNADALPEVAVSGEGSSGMTNAAKLTNTLGMKFILIKPGTFTMGTPPDEAGREAIETQHQVTISKAFYMAATPVTQAQWKTVMGNNPSHFKGDDLPVDMVNWDEAVAFCSVLSQREGKHYHLPTEAQWEYACRAGSQTAYNLGNDEAALGKAGWYKGNAGGTTHPVAQKQPNAWGLYDMHGNVWQWCSDWSGAYPAGDQTDPTGPTSGDPRISRGGSWLHDAQPCRSGKRGWSVPGAHNAHYGFRLVLDSPDEQKVVDLLKIVDVAKDSVAGKWKFRDGTLISDGSRAKIEFLYRPPAEYDYRIVFTRTAGNNSVASICYVKGHQFALDTGGWDNKIIGFSFVGGKWAVDNPTSHHSTAWLNNGQQYTTIVKVRKNGVEAYLDGKLITEWKTDYSDMSLPNTNEYQLNRNDTIGLCTTGSPTIFKTAEIIEITGKGELLK